MCTNVHDQLADGPVDQAVDRPESSAPGSCLDRSGGRSMAQRSKIQPLAGRPGGRPIGDQSAELASNGHILEAYKRGFPWTVFYKI